MLVSRHNRGLFASSYAIDLYVGGSEKIRQNIVSDTAQYLYEQK
jgi:hypothetical protein